MLLHTAFAKIIAKWICYCQPLEKFDLIPIIKKLSRKVKEKLSKSLWC
ncbi:hypothetical protein PLAN_50079 [Planktothrix rubescens CCAP 1459/22]|uniref:Uncharacterized protein n=1 Tax=Planktothrix rubescens CCAP 1459/22 TaxID=329571 RepID=A0A6J7ZQY5_PLARU|nr:hypothetical protein PLAN_50079 [Planktothrix rubescens NIVA-CYA 18]CAD5967790.1 hypothetical protein PCC7821_03577 [Planktothrix rubescens NIVA-CYA 18]